MTTGLIGLSNSGNAVATYLEKMGEELLVWGQAQPNELGLRWPSAKTLKSLIQQCDVLLLCLYEDHEVEAALTMDNGLLATNLTHKTIIDMTTCHYGRTLDIRSRINQNGGNYMSLSQLGRTAQTLPQLMSIIVTAQAQAQYHKFPSTDLGVDEGYEMAQSFSVSGWHV